jgi:hypothetical protein
VAGTWSDEWVDGGIENATVKNLSGELPVTLTIGDRVFGGSKKVKFNAKKGKTGSAK